MTEKQTDDEEFSLKNKKCPRLRVQNVTQSFPGVIALDDVSIEILPGEIHAMIGENGAGKSTLMHIVDGVYNRTRDQWKWMATLINLMMR